ncbi:MAG: hypothetical protein PHH77_08165 [Victivallaceae bacterium]|nr:hypothetical protein [Victivallaceae bacterium]MDD5698578.1 hypothetical protein [Victivallaceae bacterium]
MFFKDSEEKSFFSSEATRTVFTSGSDGYQASKRNKRELATGYAGLPLD